MRCRLRFLFYLIILNVLFGGCTALQNPVRFVENSTILSSSKPEAMIKISKDLVLVEQTPREYSYGDYDKDTEYITYALGGGTTVAIQRFVFKNEERLLAVIIQELQKGIFLGVEHSILEDSIISGEYNSDKGKMFFGISVTGNMLLRDTFQWQFGVNGENLMTIIYLEPINLIDSRLHKKEYWEHQNLFTDDQKRFIMDFKKRAEKSFIIEDLTPRGRSLLVGKKEKAKLRIVEEKSENKKTTGRAI